MADPQAKVNNHDIVGLYNRLNRFMEELIKSVSSQTSQLNEFDRARLVSYLDATDTYHNWVVAQPHLDLPETSPKDFILETGPEIPDVENENIDDLLRMLVIGRDELINSQSARDAANLNQFDSARFRAIIEKCRQFILTYVDPATPLDFPESSPQDVTSGPGRTGI